MIKDNNRICAYDCFGNEILVGDYVSCILLKSLGTWRNKNRIVLIKGIVVGWTFKRINIKLQEMFNNTDIQEDLPTLIGAEIGDILRFKPDRVCKLGQ